MSKQVDLFMKTQIEEKTEIRKEYLEKLDNIRKGRVIKVKGSLLTRYEHV